MVVPEGGTAICCLVEECCMFFKALPEFGIPQIRPATQLQGLRVLPSALCEEHQVRQVIFLLPDMHGRLESGWNSQMISDVHITKIHKSKRFEAGFHAPGLKAPERNMPVLGGEAVRLTSDVSVGFLRP